MEKSKIAHFEQFHLFPQCFPNVFLREYIWRKRLNQSLVSSPVYYQVKYQTRPLITQYMQDGHLYDTSNVDQTVQCFNGLEFTTVA